MKNVLLLAVFTAASLCNFQAQAMGYNVCVKTARHATAIQQKIQRGETTAQKEIQGVQSENLLPDTTKLLTYMYNYAEMRKDEHPLDFSNMAFRACLDFEPRYN